MTVDGFPRFKQAHELRPKPAAGRMLELRQIVAAAAGMRCQVDGIHADGCPGAAWEGNASEFVAHHVQPRSFGGDVSK